MNELIGFTLPYTENGVTKQFPFYYIKDVQGNICYIVDKFGKLVVSYNYDAWGNDVNKFFFKYGVANAKTNYSITLGTTVYTAQDIDNLNSHYYRGYYYDKETGFYYLTTRYYDPKTGRFISPDDPMYLDFEVAYGHNRYAYCCNNPVMGYDPEGTFVITAAMIWAAIGIGVGIGIVTGLGATVVQDLKNGKLLDGDVTLLSYVGNALGGGIAGAGIGLCSVLGAGLGAALYAGSALTIGGTAISGGIALAIGVGGAFVAGGLGYAVRTVISDQENFEWSDMFIEAGANAISGMLTFVGAVVGGFMGVKVPGAKFSFKNFALYHIWAAYFGLYPSKIILAHIRKKLTERY